MPRRGSKPVEMKFMSALKVNATRVDYPKKWFFLGTLVWAVATLVLVYLAWTSVTNSVRGFWILMAVVEGGLLLYLFVLPVFTHHMAGAKALHLRMGVLINETVPYEWITEVRSTEIQWGGVRVGIGVRYSPIIKAMFLTSSFRDLVVLKLDQEHRLGSPLKRPVQEIVMSVNSASTFIDMMKDRIGMEQV